MASSTAEPTAQATGLPPNVLKCRACDITEAISLVVTTAAIGNPFAIPKETGLGFQCYWSSGMQKCQCSPFSKPKACRVVRTIKGTTVLEQS